MIGNMNNNYCEVKEMTDEELYNMYDKIDKKDLINMLIECNKQLNLISIQPITYE